MTGLFVALLTLLLLGIAAWSERFSLWLLGGVALMWLLLSAMIWAMARKPYRAEREAAALCPEGTSVEVAIRLHLHGWLPLTWIVVEDDWHRKLWLGGISRTIVYRYTTPALPRGCYDSAGIKITYGDMLGFGKRQFILAAPLELAVYPLPEAVGERMERVRPMKQTWPEYRRYRDGDPLHGLNWKLSAQRDEWIIREQVVPVAVQPLILLLDGNTFEADWEQSLRTASGWLLHTYHAGAGWLGVPGEQSVQWYPVDDGSGRAAALRALAGAQSGGDPLVYRRGLAEALQRWPAAVCGVIRSGHVHIRHNAEGRGPDDERHFG